MMIPFIIGLLFVYVGVQASLELSEKDEPTWTLLSSDGADLCSETVCKTTHGNGVIFHASWAFNGDARSPRFIFRDEHDLLFSDNKTYYLVETAHDEAVWPGRYKFSTVPANNVMFRGSYNLTTPPLEFHHHSSEEFQDNRYMGDLSLSFPYRGAGQDLTVEWPVKTVIIEKHADNNNNANDNGPNDMSGSNNLD